MATLKHKTPCNECPWRRTAPKGWTGGVGAEFYADALSLNEAPMCHLNDHGPDSDKSAFCVGALRTAANECVSLHYSYGANDAKAVVGTGIDCFSSKHEFYSYHEDKPYVSYILRRIK